MVSHTHMLQIIKVSWLFVYRSQRSRRFKKRQEVNLQKHRNATKPGLSAHTEETQTLQQKGNVKLLPIYTNWHALRANQGNREQVGNEEQLKTIKTVRNKTKKTKDYQNKPGSHWLTKRQDSNTLELDTGETRGKARRNTRDYRKGWDHLNLAPLTLSPNALPVLSLWYTHF